MSIKLLVVEDVLIARKMIQIVLTQLGYQFDMAENGAEAILSFKENHYDFVFMDLGLPDINGIEVTKKLRKLEKMEVQCLLLHSLRITPRKIKNWV